MISNKTSLRPRIDRRSFMKCTGAAGVFTILPRRLIAGSGQTPPSETVCFAAVGVGGQGRSDLQGLGALGQVVAIADVDLRSVAETRKLFPEVQAFEDYRQMYDRLGKSFDAVLVATPDHWHALPTVEAMQLGKHVYTEKPACLEEGRELGNRLVAGQWNAGAVVYGSKNVLKYGSHGASSCRIVPETAMREAKAQASNRHTPTRSSGSCCWSSKRRLQDRCFHHLQPGALTMIGDLT